MSHSSVVKILISSHQFLRNSSAFTWRDFCHGRSSTAMHLTFILGSCQLQLMLSCWLLSKRHLVGSTLSNNAEKRGEFCSCLFKTSIVSDICLAAYCSQKHNKTHHWQLFKTQKVWMLFYVSGMTHICWCKGHDRVVLPVTGWTAHKGQQATRLETGLRKPRSVRCRSAAQQSNVGMKPARTSLHLALYESVSPQFLQDNKQEIHQWTGEAGEQTRASSRKTQGL